MNQTIKQYPEFKRTALNPDRLNNSGSFLRTELLILTAGCLLPSAGHTTVNQFVWGNKEGTSQRCLEIKINFPRKQQAYITRPIRPLSMVLSYGGLQKYKTVKKNNNKNNFADEPCARGDTESLRRKRRFMAAFVPLVIKLCPSAPTTVT